MDAPRTNDSSLSLQRLNGAISPKDFMLMVRLVLTKEYSPDRAEPIIATIQKAVKADIGGAYRMVVNSKRAEDMAKTIAELAEKGGCLLGSDQLELALVAGMRKLDAAA